MFNFDYSLVKDPLTGKSDECGDEGLIIEQENSLFIALLDALGHGKEAFTVAGRAKSYILQHNKDELCVIMRGLNEHMKGSRGLVASLCRINKENRTLCYSGIGNISTRIYGPNQNNLIPRDGIVGYLMPTPRRKQVNFSPEDMLVLSSDGIKEHLPLVECPDILSGGFERNCKPFT